MRRPRLLRDALHQLRPIERLNRTQGDHQEPSQLVVRRRNLSAVLNTGVLLVGLTEQLREVLRRHADTLSQKRSSSPARCASLLPQAKRSPQDVAPELPSFNQPLQPGRNRLLKQPTLPLDRDLSRSPPGHSPTVSLRGPRSGARRCRRPSSCAASPHSPFSKPQSCAAPAPPTPSTAYYP